jgi:hypothetical protein
MKLLIIHMNGTKHLKRLSGHEPEKQKILRFLNVKHGLLFIIVHDFRRITARKSRVFLFKNRFTVPRSTIVSNVVHSNSSAVHKCVC